MCGISGMIGPGASQEAARLMSNALRHRGPDGEGLWYAENVALSHRRLSIIDITGGHQPMISASGRWILVYNGEIYNFRELRNGPLAAYPYTTQCDSEVILAGLEILGEALLPLLRGMFAFAAYDRQSKRILLARDAQGIKPLYHANIGKTGFVFGSEVVALIAAGYRPKVDEKSLGTFLDVRFVPSAATLFEGVSKLPPGHAVWVDSSGLPTVPRRFTPPAPEIDRQTSLDARIDVLEQALRCAVASQLVSDVPVGVLLSGGVDSAAVAAAAVMAGGMIDTFCVGYAEEHWSNEFDAARDTANLLGTCHHELRIDANDALKGMRELVGHLEEPIVTTSVFSYFLLCQAVAQHRKVVLSGQGADEPWAGYGRHRVAALRRLLRPLAWLPERLPFAGRFEEDWSRLRGALSARGEFQEWAALNALFSQADRHRIRPDSSPGEAGAQAISHLGEVLPKGGTSLERLLAIETRSSLSDNLLMLGDKLSMAWGLEVRVPLLDADYLSLVEQTPGVLRRSGFLAGRGKHLHKLVCSRFLPKSIVNRPKLGFQSPIETWLRADLGNHLSHLIEDSRSFTRTYLQLDVARRMLSRHRAERSGSLERQLFALWMLEEWYRRFFVR